MTDEFFEVLGGDLTRSFTKSLQELFASKDGW
jgi:hypothetical protein